MVRTLTLEDRRKIALMWRRNASPVKIAAELEISQCTVYTELKRGQEADGKGGVVLDENFRPAYSAERGKTVYQRNLRNRGRRPKRETEQKEAIGNLLEQHPASLPLYHDVFPLSAVSPSFPFSFILPFLSPLFCRPTKRTCN